MRRRYNPAQAMEGIRRLRAAMPDVELTTDFIVGFPGESEEDFEDTMRFATEAEILQMHVFAYSRREGTPAATMPGQIEKSVKKERSARLIALGEELTAKRLARALETPSRPVLFETFADGIAVGRTCEFFEVAIPSSLPLDGEIRSVRTTRAENGRLIGELFE
jgi:threonylcarbamoyladenosine tRNA methylthiotransferase MtaB